MSAKLYLCRGSNEIGAARQDAVGWCRWCKKIVRARVGTGRLIRHTTAIKSQGSEEL